MHGGPPSNMKKTIPHLTLDTFSNTNEGVTLLDFYASWCGPCRALAPTLEALQDDFAREGVRIAKIDIDDQSELAERFSVTSIPTLIVLRDGVEVRRHVGAARPDALRKLVEVQASA